jgi:pyruvate dehydrogenase phosphatase
VDHAVEVLPSKIKANVSSFLETQHETKAAISPDHISEILRKDIAAFDHSVANDITSLFPGGVEQISALSDNAIRRIINDDGENSRKIVLGMRGTTALLALVNPTQSHLWVASLGDSQAGINTSSLFPTPSELRLSLTVLGEKRPSGAWAASALSSYHNAENPEEQDRIMSEHPGEQECISGDRVLGATAVTRGAFYRYPFLGGSH